MTTMHPDDVKVKINNVKVINKNIVPIQPVELDIESIESVQHKKINWLWENKIAYGKMTLFAGEPGVGKSQLLLYIASIVSLGGRFHEEKKLCDKNNVLLISGEDNADDTIKPRLLALNANLSNIHYLKGIKKVDKNGNTYYDAICIIENLADLEEKIIINKYKLIIIDPISLYLGSIDENKNKEIRSALGQLNALAERHNLAIILNSHFSKPSSGSSSNKNAIYRVMGSIGFAAAARIVFGIMKDPEDAERRLFLPIKNNIGPDKEGFVYKIKPMLVDGSIETSKVEWLNEKITLTANEILNNSNSSERPTPRLDEAKYFVLDILKFGAVPLTIIWEKAKKKEFSKDILYKARDALKIHHEKSICPGKGVIWMLPPDE